VTETALPRVEGFFDEATATVSYLVTDPGTRRCAVIDPVLGYDPVSGRTSAAPMAAILGRIADETLSVEWLIDSHVHADHLSGLAYLKRHLGGRTAIGAGVSIVQRHTAEAFGFEPDFSPDGSQWDHLFKDGERFPVGNIRARALHTPGHTPACLSILIGDALFVGDTLFMPDFGTARCDFPGGDPVTLYRSVRRLFDLPPETRVFVGHDYPPPGRAAAWETTIGAERSANRHVRDGVEEAEFVACRRARDATLAPPRLFHPSIQINVRAGNLPPVGPNGAAFLKSPISPPEAQT
jgi:glyoxylase-like metal-dependent hydrolase (beta-lactamase superfamily II)